MLWCKSKPWISTFSSDLSPGIICRHTHYPALFQKAASPASALRTAVICPSCQLMLQESSACGSKRAGCFRQAALKNAISYTCQKGTDLNMQRYKRPLMRTACWLLFFSTTQVSAHTSPGTVKKSNLSDLCTMAFQWSLVRAGHLETTSFLNATFFTLSMFGLANSLQEIGLLAPFLPSPWYSYKNTRGVHLV